MHVDRQQGLAESFALSAYDAAYLELAQRHRLPLASLDEDLRAAAIALASPFSGVDRAGLRSQGRRGAMAGILD